MTRSSRTKKARTAQAELVIAGLDPGIARTGYAVIRGGRDEFSVLESGTFETGPGVPLERRLLMLHDAMASLFEKHRPALVAVEEFFVKANRRASMSVGEARGVLLLAAARAGARVVEFTPQQVKLMMTGQGRGDKAQVSYMVRALLRIDRELGPDEGDALAVALCAGRVAGQEEEYAFQA